MNNDLSNQSREIKVLSVVGARPNFMKIAPIARTISDYNKRGKLPTIRHVIVHTGQHYDDVMSSNFFNDLELPAPDVNLEVGSASHARQTAKTMERFEPILLAQEPDFLLLVGDVNSTLACALVASKIQYSTMNGRPRPIIAHIEAGLRSFDRDMPEEINRILTDALSDMLFVTEDDAIQNLLSEGIYIKKIHLVGNVMIDSLVTYKNKALQKDSLQDIFNWIKARQGAYGVVTLHRPSNVDEAQRLSPLVECLCTIAKRLPLVFPVHPRTRENLKKFGLLERLNSTNNIYLVKPLGYLDFMKLLMSASLAITDSGGLQEETTFLKIPCLTLRENTERPITTTLGTNFLVGTQPERILSTVFGILDGKAKRGLIPPLWDGCASERILNVLLSSIIV